MNENFMKHGAFSWNELMTPDVEAARSFYGVKRHRKLTRWRHRKLTPLVNTVIQ